MGGDFFKRLALAGHVEWMVHNMAFGEAFTIEAPKNGFIVLEQIIFNGFVNNVDFATIKEVLSRCVVCLSLVEQGGQDELFYNLRVPVVTQPIPGGGGFVGENPAQALIIPTFKIFRKNLCVDLAMWPEIDTVVGTGASFLPTSQERPSPAGYGTGGPGVPVGANFSNGIGPSPINYYPNAKRPQTGVSVTGANTQQARPPFNGFSLMSYPSATAGQQNSQVKSPFLSFGYWKCTGTPEQLASIND
jgi:hypothetical protein